MPEQLTISQQIEDRQHRLNAARDKLFEHTRDPEHDPDIADGLKAEIDEQERRLRSLKGTEQALAIRAVQQVQQEVLPPLAAPAVNRRPLGLPGKERTPGDLYANYVVAPAIAARVTIAVCSSSG